VEKEMIEVEILEKRKKYINLSVWEGGRKFQHNRDILRCNQYKDKITKEWVKLRESGVATSEDLARLEGKEEAASACEHLVLCEDADCEICFVNVYKL